MGVLFEAFLIESVYSCGKKMKSHKTFHFRQERLLEAGNQGNLGKSQSGTYWAVPILGDALRLVFQNLLLETDDSILLCSQRVWRLLLQVCAFKTCSCGCIVVMFVLYSLYSVLRTDEHQNVNASSVLKNI